MADNPRVRTIVPGVEAERIAFSTHFEYRPHDVAESVLTFIFSEFLVTPNGVTSERLDGTEHVAARFGDLAARCFGEGDGDLGVDLSKVTAGDVLRILRSMSDTLYAEAREG